MTGGPGPSSRRRCGEATGRGRHGRDLLQWRRALVVCAHPDDESFGLGALLAALRDQGAVTTVLCFTHGEASTLGVAENLAQARAEELAAASAVLGVDHVELLGFPDGALAQVPLGRLASHVTQLVGQVEPDGLLVFDEGGITGHRDHRQATAAGLSAAGHLDIAVAAWVLPETVAGALNVEFGTTFEGRPRDEIDVVLPVERDAQLRAIECHGSQSTGNAVLWRRLELLGNWEHLRYLR